MTKTCIKCKEVKDVTDFSVDKRSSDGFTGRCKPCRRPITKAWYHRNKERSKKSSIEWRRKNKDRYTKKAQEWLNKNREKVNKLSREWSKRNTLRIRINVRKKKGTFNKTCEICKENRVIDWCHIIPRKSNGSNDAWNILYLCPNHHRLFDNRELNNREYAKIKEKVLYAKNLTCSTSL